MHLIRLNTQVYLSSQTKMSSYQVKLKSCSINLSFFTYKFQFYTNRAKIESSLQKYQIQNAIQNLFN